MRAGLNWDQLEPQKGHWQWSMADGWVSDTHARGAEFLPILCYTAPWAAQKKGDIFTPPANVADWENYVEQVVSRYSAPPYNLRYFQIWNEPGGFAWKGSDLQFADLVYIPAAKIIRSHHGLVVFGGLADIVPLQRFSNLMNYHDLWRWTDIVDVHYKGLDEFQQFYSAWVANGKCQGMWQTEVGATAEPGFLTDLYSRTLHWTLGVGWRNPDEFKYFWFASQGNGPQANNNLVNLNQPERLTDAGTRLAVINQVLGTGPLSIYDQFSIEPLSLGPAGGWALGYRVGSSRFAINFLMNRAVFQANQSIRVSLRLPGNPSRVQLLSGLGKSWDLPVQLGGGRVQVTVPLQNGFDDCPTCKTVEGYLVLDQ